eukprot:CAMPEP_0115869544 /NCGR_PEP_ID=MMETSP0287-20121206/21865_1 /TAXON_ID=412157 /ORGANISM="Chrysochromulina rotalis, Strain UIO044" /LENGTH=81 /DNA_ID=CAMNT_0003324237 /DNA_START=219 /DNA_END=464 /DNA_ORIENTATION=-
MICRVLLLAHGAAATDGAMADGAATTRNLAAPVASNSALAVHAIRLTTWAAIEEEGLASFVTAWQQLRMHGQWRTGIATLE